MAKIFRKIILSLLIYLFSISVTYACQPCLKSLNFSETAKEADLIIIGQKVGEGPSTSSENFNGGPEWIKVKVLEILKGNTNENEIKVRSWYGMCAYGIVLKNENPYLIFLDKGKDMYYAVNGGCAVRDFKVEGENLYFKEKDTTRDTQKISIDELVKKIGPSTSRQKISILEKKTFFQIYKNYIILSLIVVLIIFIILLILIILLIKKKRNWGQI